VTAAGSPRLKLLLIPPDVATAAALARCDVDRAFVDLEVIGKRERQAHVAAHFSHHTLADLPAYRDATVGVELLVRTNPIHDGTEDELAAVLAAAPDVVMLPMVRHPREVERFVRRVGGRARVSLLVETPQAFVRLAELLDAGGVDEVHIGLNDLHLAMGLDFMFEVVTSGFLEVLAGVCAERGVRFGVGGVARVDEGAVPGRLVLGEHVRLGSEAVILSRTFTRRAASSEVVDPEELAAEVARLRAAEAAWRRASPEELLRNREELRRRVREVAFGERVTPA
jgi:hypothetical protein